MKANEAPEKIYLQDSISTDTVEDLWPEWFDAKVSDNSIEYTRTDAFIEKACEFLKEHREEVRTEDNGIVGWIEDCFIENFKEYLKK